MAEQTPERLPGESPGRYMRRVLGYLTEPQRRRLGRKAESEMLAAIHELESDR
jgi:hypothetical protein